MEKKKQVKEKEMLSTKLQAWRKIKPSAMRKVIEKLGYSKKKVDEKTGYLVELEHEGELDLTEVNFFTLFRTLNIVEKKIVKYKVEVWQKDRYPCLEIPVDVHNPLYSRVTCEFLATLSSSESIDEKVLIFLLRRANDETLLL